MRLKTRSLFSRLSKLLSIFSVLLVLGGEIPGCQPIVPNPPTPTPPSVATPVCVQYTDVKGPYYVCE